MARTRASVELDHALSLPYTAMDRAADWGLRVVLVIAGALCMSIVVCRVWAMLL